MSHDRDTSSRNALGLRCIKTIGLSDEILTRWDKLTYVLRPADTRATRATYVAGNVFTVAGFVAGIAMIRLDANSMTDAISVLVVSLPTSNSWA